MKDHPEQDDLLSFVSSLAGDQSMRVEETLGGGYVRLRVSEAERRQAKQDIRCVEDAVIEMLRNARDAGAQHVFVATGREGAIRRITVLDDGTGIPPHLHKAVFEARVTSKLNSMHEDRWGVHGRGMALYSIYQTAVEARVMASDIGRGCALYVAYDTNEVTERADQHTWPDVTNMQAAEPVVKGPRNILRACTEFALESKDACRVYVGSTSEIVATMRVRTPAASVAETPGIVQLASTAPDSRALARIAAGLGLDMSERTAHRIIRSEIQPLRNALSVASKRGTGRATGDWAAVRTRNVQLSSDDRHDLEEAFVRDFARIAAKYYLTPTGDVSMRFSDGKLHVSLGYEDDD